jgi:hypothetical protein
MTIRTLKISSILACPFAILSDSHYREDESCKCNDQEERDTMIREWGYTPSDFENIPLKQKEQ